MPAALVHDRHPAERREALLEVPLREHVDRPRSHVRLQLIQPPSAERPVHIEGVPGDASRAAGVEVLRAHHFLRQRLQEALVVDARVASGHDQALDHQIHSHH